MPTNLRAGRRLAALAVSCAALLTPALALAQSGTKSPAAAKELTAVLDRLKLDAIAAADPADAGTFVAALYFQGAQLLVVSAKYSAPSLLVAKLAKKDYRDVYIDLNAASIAGSKIFVMDQTCDGLVAKPGDNAADTLGTGHHEHGLRRGLEEGEDFRGRLHEGVRRRRRQIRADPDPVGGAGEKSRVVSAAPVNCPVCGIPLELLGHGSYRGLRFHAEMSLFRCDQHGPVLLRREGIPGPVPGSDSPRPPGSANSFVPAWLRPRPTLRSGAVALPEPDDAAAPDCIADQLGFG